MATCTQTVIYQSGTLGCIICWEIKYDIVFIMNSLFMYIVLAIVVTIHIRPKHYQNLDNFGHSCCICHLLVLYDMIYI